MAVITKTAVVDATDLSLRPSAALPHDNDAAKLHRNRLVAAVFYFLWLLPIF